MKYAVTYEEEQIARRACPFCRWWRMGEFCAASDKPMIPTAYSGCSDFCLPDYRYLDKAVASGIS